ncbi:CaiB/BaiF CoA transferase family protein [Thermodesulfobacteriota bacterium]
MIQGALTGVRVLDLTQFLSGPRCTQLMAEAGAEVIKIEPPDGEAMRKLTVLSGAERILSNLNRNKKGLVLNLQSEKGRELLKGLVKASDVLVENFTPGLMDKMGLGYEALSAVNPRLVYAVISGFGRTGPLSERTAFDIISQATGGIMNANGMDDRPPAIFFGDLVSGAYCTIGILEAIICRERTGRGQLVDISMQDVMYYQHFSAHSKRALAPVEEEVASILGKPIDRLMTDRDQPLCFWNAYPARDGYVAIVALSDSQWNRLMEAVGRPDLVGDERFGNFVLRVHNTREGVEVVDAWTREHTVAEVVKAMEEARVPCGAVLDADALGQDEQLKARGMLCEVDQPRLGKIGVPGTPVKLSDTPGGVESACPELGEHTEEILSSILGLSAGEIETLRSEGTI